MDKDTQPQIFDLNLPDSMITGMVTRRVSKAKAHWEQKFGLTKVREANKSLYTGEYLNKQIRDQRYEDIFSDNRLFTSVRTILPFVTARIAQPEVIPANGDDVSVHFSQDFEKVLVGVAEEEYARDKVRLAMQDVLKGQRVGILMWAYDPNKDGIVLTHLDPCKVTIGNKARLHEEPDLVQIEQKRTVGDLVRQFPDKKDKIFQLLDIQKGVPSQLEQEKDTTETWLYVEDGDGETQLAVVFMMGNHLLGAMTDPNWSADDKNMIQNQMMPFMFFNVLNDGSGYIDETSFIEQAQYNQKNYDKRGQTIALNAAYGGVGVPVFGKGAIKSETAAKVQFNPTQRIMLDVADVSKSFTTWNTGPLATYIIQDKLDMRNNVDNIFGTPNVFRGEQTDANTLGQDVLIRDQAEGRQGELVDAVENSMQRFYQVEAQLVYRYFDEDEYYNFIGSDGQFESIVVNDSMIAKLMGIKVNIQSGSSMPIDRSQRKAIAIELMKAGRLGTLRLYKELGIDDAEEAYKEYLTEKIYPFSLLQEEDKAIYSREAAMDLAVVIDGKKPEERDDIEQNYIGYLNNYLLTNKYEDLTTKQQSDVKSFIDDVLKQAQEKLQKLGSQVPTNNSTMMGTLKKSTLLSYKDAPPDVQRQIEAADGLQPSQMGNQAMPYQLPKSAVTAAGQSSEPSNRIVPTAP